jgi:hypothetical protein
MTNGIDTTPPSPYPGGAFVIARGGHSVIISSSKASGGYIENPASAADQGLSVAETLYVDPTWPAATHATATTVAIQPGGRYDIPSNVKPWGVWVNAVSSGHIFVAVQLIPADQLPATQAELNSEYTQGNYPPTGPSGVLSPILSYLYQEYSLDDDLQAFVNAYNSMMQDIVDTFNGLNLPIYIQDPISGALLDWVGNGVYGYPRPVIVYFDTQVIGPYNTFLFNQKLWAYNRQEQPGPVSAILSDDDIYRRCLTWHFYKGDGKYFSVQWLKKRVMRWVMGTNGTSPNIDNTYQISVTFNPYSQYSIRFINGIRTIKSSYIFNTQKGMVYNAPITNNYNDCNTSYQALVPLPFEQQFAAAMASGVLELPFQYTYNVVIG